MGDNFSEGLQGKINYLLREVYNKCIRKRSSFVFRYPSYAITHRRELEKRFFGDKVVYESSYDREQIDKLKSIANCLPTGISGVLRSELVGTSSSELYPNRYEEEYSYWVDIDVPTTFVEDVVKRCVYKFDLGEVIDDVWLAIKHPQEYTNAITFQRDVTSKHSDLIESLSRRTTDELGSYMPIFYVRADGVHKYDGDGCSHVVASFYDLGMKELDGSASLYGLARAISVSIASSGEWSLRLTYPDGKMGSKECEISASEYQPATITEPRILSDW